MPRKSTNSLDETKAVRDLRERIREREGGLERAIAEVEVLKLELVFVQREYESRVAPLSMEADSLDEKIFELKKIKDLMDKGENLEDARRIVRDRDRARDERERERSGYEKDASDEGEGEEAKSVERKPTTPELKKLWRLLAYRFHPDLTQDSEEKAEREMMMKRLNDAYQRGDVEEMREIEATGCCGAEASVGTSEAELKERLLDLDEALRRVTQRLLAFKRSPWYDIRMKVRKGKREKRDYMAELANVQIVEVEVRKKLIARIEKELEELK